MKDEGYVKFKCSWIKEELEDKNILQEINIWRDKLYNLHLIGAYADGVGYGNISIRIPDNSFMITGTTTGKIQQLTEKHYTRVTGYDIDNNLVTCEGPIMASSESMTHAVIYDCIPSANAVVHIHNTKLWIKLMDIVPTSSSQASYGTPEMAFEIKRLLHTSALKHEKILVMAGHEGGLIAFGKDMDEAGNKVLDYFN